MAMPEYKGSSADEMGVQAHFPGFDYVERPGRQMVLRIPDYTYVWA